MIRVVISEDHNSFIEGIELFFKFEDDISIVGTANTGKEALEIIRKKHVDILITDIKMPDIDGIQLAYTIQKDYQHIRVIAFTMFDQSEAFQNMMKAGVKGYLLKNSSLKNLLDAIRTVYSGNTYYDPNLPFLSTKDSNTKNHRKKGVLTTRQQEILELIVQRKSNSEIADLLFIGKLTVATHRRNMIQKLNLSGPNALLSYAIKKRYDFD